MGWFNGWFGTRWYALLYGNRNEEDASALALPILSLGGLQPGDRLLDMGCGRGRHAEIFAAAGLEVTGIDLSETSIAAAQARVPLGRFEVFDIRKPYAHGAFDAVVCLFTCLGYSADRNDDQEAVEAAATALRPGGLFVLDLLNGEYVVPHLVPSGSCSVDEVTFTIQRYPEGSDIVKKITVVEDGNTHRFEERVHAWRADEVTDMLMRAGLRVEHLTDGSCSSPFQPQLSDRMVVWARKPK